MPGGQERAGTAPVACLTIGSSDSSGGAGIQGDIKAFASIGCYAATVVVGVTAQSTAGVVARHGIPLPLVQQQFRVILDDLPIAGIKVGTTWDAALVRWLGEVLGRSGVPVVVDPVMVTATGAWLTDADEVRTAVVQALFPIATVVTPNLRESELLTGSASACASRRELAESLCRLGARAVVVTAGAHDCGDWFFDGSEHHLVGDVRHETNAEHGVGCAHSALMAGLLAHGWPLSAAVEEAHRRAAEGVRRGLVHLGSAVHPVDVLDLWGRGPA